MLGLFGSDMVVDLITAPIGRCKAREVDRRNEKRRTTISAVQKWDIRKSWLEFLR